MQMILTLFCVLYSTYRIEAVPAPGHGVLDGFCIINEDCNLDHHTTGPRCCVSFTLPGENRTVGPGDVTRFVKGACKLIPGRNQVCLQPHSFPGSTNDIRYVQCPCMPPYVCDDSGEIVSPVGRLGVCRIRCISTSDCPKNECCVENNSLQMGLTSARGLCQPMGDRGSKCLQVNGSGRPSGVVKHSCPCKKELTCGYPPNQSTGQKQTATCDFFIG